MKPQSLRKLASKGKVESYDKGEVFYSLDFKEEFYIIKSGYVKRYAITEERMRIIESIYGPGYFFPLSPVFKKILSFDLSQESGTYVYQAMTDLEIQGFSSERLIEEAEKNPIIYRDLLYESGRRLKANINRLASNALTDPQKKVSHQLAYLAQEFGETKQKGVVTSLTIMVPLRPIDMAEQLHVPVKEVEIIMEDLVASGLLEVANDIISVPDINLLKAAYL